MAKKASSTKEIIINNINVRPANRNNPDIARWRSALKAAETGSFSRQQLYDIYEEILLDGHLKSLLDKRINAVLNMELKFFSFENKEDEELNKIINKSYFETLLREIMLAKFYGITLCQLDWSTVEGYLNQTLTIDRRHVKPELSIVAANPSDTSGLSYTEHPYALFVGQLKDYGLLLQAAPYVIYARANVSDWAEFNEVFGKPFLQGSYENDTTADLLTRAFEAAGVEQFVVAPEDAKILMNEAKNTGQSGFEAFDKRMEDKLSVLILGQNLTTNVGDTGSFAASKIHGQVEETINSSDREFVIRTLNEKLIPILQTVGYSANGEFKFVYSDSIPLIDRIVIDTQIANLVPIDDAYFYDTYNVPKGTAKPIVGAPVVGAPLAGAQKQNQKKLSFFTRLESFFRERAVLKF